MHLLCNQRTERLQALVAKEIGEANLAHELPVRARLREDNVLAAGNLSRDGRLGAEREGAVVGLEDLAGHGRRGGDEDRDGTKAQEHERAMGVREEGEGVVRLGAKEVEVADDREGARGGREIEPLQRGRGCSSEEDEGQQQEDKESREEQESKVQEVQTSNGS